MESEDEETEEQKQDGRTLRLPRLRSEPDIINRICNNLELTMPLDLAAEAEGVSRATVHRWMAEFPDFARRITHARAVGAKKMTEQSLRGEKGCGNAQWHLERRFREQYGAPKDEQPAEVTIIIEGGLPRRQ